YGIVNLINSFLQMALYIVSMSLGSGIVRFYLDYKDNQEQLKRYLGSVILFVIVSSGLFTVLGFIFKDILINTLFDGLAFYPYVFIALVTMSFLTLHKIHQDIMQAMQFGRKLSLVYLSVSFLYSPFFIFYIISIIALFISLF